MKECIEQPQIVRWTAESLSALLGRPACVRREKNGRHWFINDPLFSYLQVGLRSGTTDYRAGFLVDAAPASIRRRFGGAAACDAADFVGALEGAMLLRRGMRAAPSPPNPPLEGEV